MKVGTAGGAPLQVDESGALEGASQDQAENQQHNQDQQDDEESSKKKKKDPDDEEKQTPHGEGGYYDEESHYSSKLIRSSRTSIATQRAYCWIRVLMLLAAVIAIAVVVPLMTSSRKEEETNSAVTTKDTVFLSGEQEIDDREVDGGVTNDTMASSLDPTIVTPPELDHTPVSAFCPTSTPLNMTFAFDQAVSGMVALHEDLLGIPAHLEYNDNHNTALQEGDFNVSSYFQVLEGLSLLEGKVLEYFYRFGRGGGAPVLYVRDINTEKPFLTAQDFEEHNCEEEYPCVGGILYGQHYVDQIILEGTPKSYVNLVILAILGKKFYVPVHWTSYDNTIIYGDESVQSVLESLGGMCACSEDPPTVEHTFHTSQSPTSSWQCRSEWREGYLVGKISSEDLDLFRQTVDLTPTLECDNDEVRVSVVVFSNWGGFDRRTYAINRHYGCIVHDALESEELFPFICNVEDI